MNKVRYIKNLIYNILNEGYTPIRKEGKSNNIFCRPNDVTISHVNTINGVKPIYMVKVCGVKKEDIAAIKRLDAVWARNLIIGDERVDKFNHSFNSYYIIFKFATDRVDKWFNGTFASFIEFLKSRKKYNPDSFFECQKQIQKGIREAIDPETETNMVYKNNIGELDDAIKDAIKNGEWGEALKLYKIDLKSRLYGHQLSPKNQRLIYSQALKAGLTRESDNWPTFVMSEKKWNDLGFAVIDEPKMAYHIVTNVDPKQSASRGLQAMGISSSEAGQQTIDKAQMTYTGDRFHGIAYDVSDVEDISNNGEWFKQAGLSNNLTGALNQAAKELENAKLADEKNSLEYRKRKQSQGLNTVNGRAFIFNQALKQCKPNLTYIHDNDKLAEYLTNLKVYGTYIANQMKYKGEDKKFYIELFAAIVGSQTIGHEYIENPPSQLEAGYEEHKEYIINSAYATINKMHQIIDAKFVQEYENYDDDTENTEALNEATVQQVRRLLSAKGYGELNKRERYIDGYMRIPVKGKWNYIKQTNGPTIKRVFGFNLDYATPFDPMSKTAQIKVNDAYYTLIIKNGVLFVIDPDNEDILMTPVEFKQKIKGMNKGDMERQLANKKNLENVEQELKESFNRLLQRMDKKYIL